MECFPLLLSSPPPMATTRLASYPDHLGKTLDRNRRRTSIAVGQNRILQTKCTAPTRNHQKKHGKAASGQVLIPQKIVAAMIPIQVGLGVCWAFRTECGHCKRGLDVICCHLERPLRRVSLCGMATKSIPPCDTLLQGCGDVQQWRSNSQAEKTTVSLDLARERNMFSNAFLASSLTKGTLILNCLDCNGCKSGNVWKQAAS